MLGHRAQSGKDTFFSFVENQYGYKRVALADKLKSVVQDLYQFSNEQMYGSLKDIEDKRYPNLVDQRKILSPEWEHELIDVAVDNGFEESLMYINNPEYKQYLTPRRVLQIFGQHQRELYPDIWVDYIFNVSIPSLIKDGHKKIIITDFRFTNEANFAQNWAIYRDTQLIFIKIDRPNIKKNLIDISENDLNSFKDWNYIIQNDSSLEDYKNKCFSLIDSIK